MSEVKQESSRSDRNDRISSFYDVKINRFKEALGKAKLFMPDGYPKENWNVASAEFLFASYSMAESRGEIAAVKAICDAFAENKENLLGKFTSKLRNSKLNIEQLYSDTCKATCEYSISKVEQEINSSAVLEPIYREKSQALEKFIELEFLRVMRFRTRYGERFLEPNGPEYKTMEIALDTAKAAARLTAGLIVLDGVFLEGKGIMQKQVMEIWDAFAKGYFPVFFRFDCLYVCEATRDTHPSIRQALGW